MRTWTSLLLMACGPAVGVPQGSGGETTSSTDGAESSTTDPVPTTTAATTVGPTTTPPDPVTTIGSETTGSTSTAGTEASTSTGEEVCGPIEELVARVRFDNGGELGASTLACTIESVQEGFQTLAIRMMCDGVSHTLRVTTPVDPWVPIGSDVVLDVHFTGDGFSDELVVVLTTVEGGLILAGSTSAEIAGDGVVEPDFFGPLSVAVNSGICETQQIPGTDFIGPCYDYQRESITFGLHGDEVTVLDHNRDLLGTYEAVVEIAELRIGNTCDDTEHWYQWVVYEPMPGG